MFEQERERGIGLARLPRGQRDEMVARLMFGRHWKEARTALLMLMGAWGLGAANSSETGGVGDHE
jgi:hypothetical protein